MVNRVLMIPFHFPPQSGSSGIQRSLKFSQYLPEYGWEPIVLTAHERAYPSTSSDQLCEIAQHVKVHRAFAIDAARHLSIFRRYLGVTALPDRWIYWLLGAVPSGLRLIRENKPAVIWTTYPIATSHLIGYVLHRLTGIPWVADFRDPMTDENYPPNPTKRRLYRWIEKITLSHCVKAVFTTPGAARNLSERYPSLPTSHFCLIENGFDEGNFSNAETNDRHAKQSENNNKQFVLLHSGIIYPSERDPIPLFKALSALRRQGVIASHNFQLVLRAAHHKQYLLTLIEEHDINDIVSLPPPIPYKEALAEMLAADGLLILQASNCNAQIPAKMYEYLRARRPILALTDPAGDTAVMMRKAGLDTIAPLDSKERIMTELSRFIALVKIKAAPIAALDYVDSNSRKSRTQQLATLFDQIIAENK